MFWLVLLQMRGWLCVCFGLVWLRMRGWLCFLRVFERKVGQFCSVFWREPNINSISDGPKFRGTKIPGTKSPSTKIPPFIEIQMLNSDSYWLNRLLESCNRNIG